VQSAIDVYYGEAGPGTLRGPAKEFVDSDDYKSGIVSADCDIREKLLSMMKKRDPQTKTVTFQTSLLMSDVHKPQEAHVDYDTKTDYPQRYMIAFLPLTETGQFLQFWHPTQKDKHGEIVFIPRGELLLVPGATIHGGGFRADHRTDDEYAHMRLHFYVYPNTNQCEFAEGEHKNDYVSTVSDYLNHPELIVPKKGIRGSTATGYFHGYSV
jgi:hypothetical protein